LCPVIDNHHGAGRGDGQFVMNLDCKVHGKGAPRWSEEEQVLVDAISAQTGGRLVRIDGDDIVYSYVGYDGIEHERRYSTKGRERKHALRDAAIAARHDHSHGAERDAVIRRSERARLAAALRAAVSGQSTEHDAGVRYAASLIERETVGG
jgi:hypothetical protein